MNKAIEGQPAYNQHGALLIKTTLIGDGVSLYIADSAGRVDELSKTFTDLDKAAAYYRHVAQAAEQGKRVYQIVWEVQALEEAQNAATGRTAEQVADAINADADLAQAKVERVHNALVAAKDDIVAQADPNWRSKVRAEMVQAVKQANRFTVPTRTGVHTKSLTPAELDLIANHVDGTVRTRPGRAWTVLRAIVRRGFGSPVYGTRRRIVAVELNQRGINAAAEQRSAA